MIQEIAWGGQSLVVMKIFKRTDWGFWIYWRFEDKSCRQLRVFLPRRASSSKCFPNLNKPKLAHMKNRDVSSALPADAKISAHTQSLMPFNLSSKLKSVSTMIELMKTCHAGFAQAAETIFSSRRKIIQFRRIAWFFAHLHDQRRVNALCAKSCATHPLP